MKQAISDAEELGVEAALVQAARREFEELQRQKNIFQAVIDALRSRDSERIEESLKDFVTVDISEERDRLIEQAKEFLFQDHKNKIDV